MKKTVRNIVVLLIVLLVLGGAVFFLMNLPTDEGGEESSQSSSSDSEERTALFDREDADIESVEVKNGEDEYTIIPTQKDSQLGFTLRGYEDYDFNTSQVSANVRTMLGLSPSKELGSQESLDAFGLGSAGAKVTVNYKDGGSDQLVLGDAAPETTGKYVLKDGEVYIVLGVPDAFYSNKFSYFETSVYVIPSLVDVTVDDEGETSETEAEDKLESLTLSGAHFPETISIKPSSKYLSGYGIAEPITAESGNTKFTDLLTSLKTLTASSVVDAGITEEKLEQYGLSEPDAKLSFSLNGSEHEVAVSAKDSSGMRYMIADENNLVYKVANGTVANWADISLMDLRMSYVWIANIKEVKKLTVTLNGSEVHSFDITREKNEEKSTDTSTEYDITKITDAGGNTIDYEVYQPFYQKLIGMAVFTLDKVSYSGTPAMEIKYEYFNGGSDTVEYYEVSGNRYAALLNGSFNGQVRGTDFDSVVDLLP